MAVRKSMYHFQELAKYEFIAVVYYYSYPLL